MFRRVLRGFRRGISALLGRDIAKEQLAQNQAHHESQYGLQRETLEHQINRDDYDRHMDQIQMEREDTAWQRKVQDMAKAGLHPALAAGGHGAAAAGGSQGAVAAQGQPQQPTKAQSQAMFALQMAEHAARIGKTRAETRMMHKRGDMFGAQADQTERTTEDLIRQIQEQTNVSKATSAQIRYVTDYARRHGVTVGMDRPDRIVVRLPGGTGASFTPDEYVEFVERTRNSDMNLRQSIWHEIGVQRRKSQHRKNMRRR